MERREARGNHRPDRDRHRADRRERGRHRPPRACGDDDCEQQRPWGHPRQPEPADVHVDRRRIEKLGRGDAVAGCHLECQRDVHRDRQRHARASHDHGHEQRDGDRDRTRPPQRESREQQRPIRLEQERRKESGHEEHRGVEQGQDTDAIGGLAQHIGRQAGSVLPRVGGAPASLRQNLQHTGRAGLGCLAGL